MRNKTFSFTKFNEVKNSLIIFDNRQQLVGSDVASAQQSKQLFIV